MAIVPGLALIDRILKPEVQNRQPPDKAKQEYVGTPAVVVDPLASAQNDKEETDRGHDRAT